MAVRGVYSRAEEAMLAEWQDRLDKQVGWIGEEPTIQIPYPVTHRVATKELIIHNAMAADYWNPLWRDENYARNTRWGGIIAFPFFTICVCATGTVDYFLKIPPEIGDVRINVCHCWEFYKPIRIGDSFRVFIGRHRVKDITRDEPEANRRFKYDVEVQYFNQKDEIVTILRRSDRTTIFPKGTIQEKKDVQFAQEYRYTEEDIAAIDQACDAEEIRGAKPRYWEDVNVGDTLTPVVMGPITAWDTVVEMQGVGLALYPMRVVRKHTAERVVVDPVTNIPHKSIELHMTERGAQIQPMGRYSTTINASTIENTLCRLVTNWMGDDGFLRKLEFLKFSNVPLGDTVFGRGKVKRKYIDDNGDYMVELDVWLETVRGYVGDGATAIVNLISREKTLSF